MPFTNEALNVIYGSISPIGILASSITKDNYARVWARDSSITGITGILINDTKIVEALKLSLSTLANHQGGVGQIPSNVSQVQSELIPSYGSLAGRVDATTWWIIASMLYINHAGDHEFKVKIESSVRKAIDCLASWEYNDRHLLYTPLGGNWADEYICSGYTLYDNLLYYWALHLAGIEYEHESWLHKSKLVKQTILLNFRKNENQNHYHPTAMSNSKSKPYFWFSLGPNGYDERFDMAANALALFLGFYDDTKDLISYLQDLKDNFSNWLLPVFHPIIETHDPEWYLLEGNYSYRFKNNPHHFHNGGCWPVFLGWLCQALKKNNPSDIISASIFRAYNELLTNYPDELFAEYIDTKDFRPNGVQPLCFSASGYILMQESNKNNILASFKI